MADLEKSLTQYRYRIEHTLDQLLDTQTCLDDRLLQAMRYCTLNGGKRLRPILVYVTGSSLGQSVENLDMAAAAVECIHCYSLIHDDLPAMDDDKLRRGKPTCHLAFDEATAILAGDALQTLAFSCLSHFENTNITPKSQLKMIQHLAFASGAQGMVAGQSLDLQAEGKTISTQALETIHNLKTGALFKASILLGAYAANCDDPEIIKQLSLFADQLGLAFQLQDDLLDHIGESDKLGKLAGQDIKRNKATYTTMLGVPETKAHIQTLTQGAIDALNKISINTSLLNALCIALMNRTQ